VYKTKSQNRIIELLPFKGHGSSTLGKNSWDNVWCYSTHLLEHIGNMGNMSGWTLRTIDNLWEHAQNTKSQNLNLKFVGPTPPTPQGKKKGPHGWVLSRLIG